MQMWSHFLVAGVDRSKTDKQPNALLLELWRQYRPEKQCQVWEVPTAGDAVDSFRSYIAAKDVPLDALFHFE